MKKHCKCFFQIINEIIIFLRLQEALTLNPNENDAKNKIDEI